MGTMMWRFDSSLALN